MSICVLSKSDTYLQIQELTQEMSRLQEQLTKVEQTIRQNERESVILREQVNLTRISVHEQIDHTNEVVGGFLFKTTVLMIGLCAAVSARVLLEVVVLFWGGGRDVSILV